MKKTVSIIVPVYNEQESLFLLYEELSPVLKEISDIYDWECIFVNDGSRDASWQVISALRKQDKRIKGISFSRNFGHQMALTAGVQKGELPRRGTSPAPLGLRRQNGYALRLPGHHRGRRPARLGKSASP